MNHLWSWIFFFRLFGHLSFVLTTPLDDGKVEKHSSLTAFVARTVHVEPSKMIGPIVGGTVGGVAMIALGIFLYFRFGRHRHPDLEDGLATPQVSGRAWFSRFQKFNRDTPNGGGADEKTPYSAPYSAKTAALTDGQLSAVPRYLKAEVSFGGTDLSPADRPLPPSPAYPRSPRALPSRKGKSLTLTVPSPPPYGRSPTRRSPSQRKLKVAPQPVVVSNGSYGSLPSASGRKRTLLPNFIKQRPADRNPRIPPGYEQAQAEYAQKMQHSRSGYNSTSPYPYTPRTGSDLSIEDDIADLPVKTPMNWRGRRNP